MTAKKHRLGSLYMGVLITRIPREDMVRRVFAGFLGSQQMAGSWVSLSLKVSRRRTIIPARNSWHKGFRLSLRAMLTFQGTNSLLGQTTPVIMQNKIVTSDMRTRRTRHSRRREAGTAQNLRGFIWWLRSGLPPLVVFPSVHHTGKAQRIPPKVPMTMADYAPLIRPTPYSAAVGAEWRASRSTLAIAAAPGHSSVSHWGSGSAGPESGNASSSSPRPFGNNSRARGIS